MHHKACQGPSWQKDACLFLWRLWFCGCIKKKRKIQFKKLNFFAKSGEQFPTQADPKLAAGIPRPQSGPYLIPKLKLTYGISMMLE